MAVYDDDASVAADVAEGLVVGAGDYVAAVATHEAELGLRRSLVGVPGVILGGAGGGGEGIRRGSDGGGGGCWRSSGEWWWGLHGRS